MAQSAEAASAATAPGTIAYIRNGTELHLVQADGSHDHIIWTAPAAGGFQSWVRNPAWRPDGEEIAFASNMEQATSLLESDIYAVQPDGSGLRKISDPPLTGKLDTFPKGGVALRVTNQNQSDSVFLVYVQGARQPQSVVVPAGTTKTVTFTDVAIFPGRSQFPVAIDGTTRWYGFPDTQTFQPGTVNGARVEISSSGFDDFGARAPIWRRDSAEVDYPIGQGCTPTAIAAYPPAGSQWGNLLVNFSASICLMDRGPVPALQDQIVYWDYLGNFPDGAFMRTTEGGSQATALLDTGMGTLVYGIKWLPDGSGFLYSWNDGNCYCSNIYEYDFGSQRNSQLTHFTEEYAGNLSISPNGQMVIFEHFTVDPNPLMNPDAKPDLWLMQRNGSGAGLFIRDGRDPSWGSTAAAAATHATFLPAIMAR